jgi:GTPase SAR1 family protein
VVIGDGACGKTSMLLAYTQGSFNQVHAIGDLILLFVVLHTDGF